jgi:hypothetical protein
MRQLQAQNAADRSRASAKGEDLHLATLNLVALAPANERSGVGFEEGV